MKVNTGRIVETLDGTPGGSGVTTNTVNSVMNLIIAACAAFHAQEGIAMWQAFYIDGRDNWNQSLGTRT